MMKSKAVENLPGRTTNWGSVAGLKPETGRIWLHERFWYLVRPRFLPAWICRHTSSKLSTINRIVKNFASSMTIMRDNNHEDNKVPTSSFMRANHSSINSNTAVISAAERSRVLEALAAPLPSPFASWEGVPHREDYPNHDEFMHAILNEALHIGSSLTTLVDESARRTSSASIPQ